MMKVFGQISFIFMLVFGFWGFSSAQTVNPADTITIGIDSVPENPAPGESVTINLTSFSTDLNRANISWQVGGETVLSGYGRKSFSTKAPAAGQTLEIKVVITTGNGIAVERNIFITPQDVDILWEAVDSYTPPFYRGKALPGREAIVRIVAIPHFKNTIGQNINSGDLVYNWKQNYNNMQDYSGYGKNSYTYKNAFLDKEDKISVTITSRDGSVSSQKELTIRPSSSEVVFYKYEPLKGILYNQALGTNTNLTSDEINIVGEPYFISTNYKNISRSSNNISWKINGSSANSSGTRNQITLQKPDGVSGTSSVEISVTNPNTVFQKISGILNIEF
ncbi:hypothetical protein KC842_01180 [Candidatus Nomurabacteria bacterium]|nr:hypothetical protein [Candidatus Nomurabacteria bacterium]USN94673.1 MAG: hypothetical protein H6791_02865 [Candidatus Nomurabacteria bacterium]